MPCMCTHCALMDEHAQCVHNDPRQMRDTYKASGGQKAEDTLPKGAPPPKPSLIAKHRPPWVIAHTNDAKLHTALSHIYKYFLLITVPL